MMQPTAMDRSTGSVWAAPVVLGALMSAGLTIALVGDGYWDVLACSLLASVMGYAAVAAFLCKALRRRS